MRKLLVITLLAIFALPALSQTEEQSVEKIIENIIEYLEESGEEESLDVEVLYDDLTGFFNNKIDLNKTTKDELQRLVFLSDNQIESILSYVYYTKGMKSIYELQLIDGLDYFTIKFLLPFVQIGVVEKDTDSWNLKEVFRRTKHEFFGRTDGTLEQKRGYREKEYLGSPFYGQFRYKFSAGQKIQAGVSAEKDAGEQFWGKYNKGFDSYTAYAQLDKLWKFQRIVLGDFRVTFGQGLLFNGAFMAGKSSFVMNVTPSQIGLTRKASTDEFNFFRGVGATAKFGGFEATAFYSFRHYDARVDTTTGEFTSLDKSGIFRRERDWEKRRTLNMQVLGANFNYRYKNLRVGLSLYQNWLSRPMAASTELYKLYDFRGKSQTAASIDYYYRLGRFTFFGETALNQALGVATLNGITISPTSIVNLALLHRYFSPKYDLFFNKAFAKSSSTKNENGIYLAAEINPIKRWKISAYADVFQFPHLRYNAALPSQGFDGLLKIDFAPNRKIDMYLRGKYSNSEQNYTDPLLPTRQLEQYQKASIRYNLNYDVGNFRFRSIVEGNFAKTAEEPTTQGFALNQDVTYSTTWQNLSFSVHYVFFDATSFNNRFYFYERDVPYSMYTPMLYGVGNRYMLLLKMDVVRDLTLYLRFAQTIYADNRQKISSGWEEILGDVKSDFKVALRWKFNCYRKYKKTNK